MCNIAGYSGNQQAAPILLEMLRRQQPFDGDMSTGIATIHEGKLYCRKIVGDVDTLIRETDVLNLPGTIGIAHSRPGGNPSQMPYHPFLSPDGKLALITNGTTPKSKYSHLWDEASQMLVENGYRFLTESPDLKGPYPTLKNGNFVFPVESRAYLADYYLKKGLSPQEALTKTCDFMYSDNVTVFVSADFPDEIFALRTTRPMEVILEGGEMYMATCRWGFPAELKNDPFMLPLFRPCSISKNGIRISSALMQGEPVAEMTPFTYREGYRRIEELLHGEKWLEFDDLEIAVGRNMRDLWEGDHTCVQHARLVYDILWRMEKEGKLKKEIHPIQTKFGIKHRYFFHLED